MTQCLTCALRRCPPLRDAVYRNRTPDRGLRHAVSLACLPFGTFAAVASWLSAWDVVPAAEACAKVEALHINTRTNNHHESLQFLTDAAEIIFEAATGPLKPVPFAKVKSVEFTFTSLDDHSGREEACDHAVRHMLQKFPSLQHLQIPRPLNMRGRYIDQVRPEHPSAFWVAGTGGVRTQYGSGKQVPFSEVFWSFRRDPELTSLDLCDNTLNMRGVFFTSLLLCRGSVKRVTWNAGCAIKDLISPTGNPSSVPTLDDVQLRLAIDAPVNHDPAVPLPKEVERHYHWRGLPRSVVAGVPVHWTLEKFVMRNGGVQLPMTDLLVLVRMCPRLKELHIESCQSQWFGEEACS